MTSLRAKAGSSQLKLFGMTSLRAKQLRHPRRVRPGHAGGLTPEPAGGVRQEQSAVASLSEGADLTLPVVPVGRASSGRVLSASLTE